MRYLRASARFGDEHSDLHDVIQRAATRRDQDDLEALERLCDPGLERVEEQTVRVHADLPRTADQAARDGDMRKCAAERMAHAVGLGEKRRGGGGGHGQLLAIPPLSRVGSSARPSQACTVPPSSGS